MSDEAEQREAGRLRAAAASLLALSDAVEPGSAADEVTALLSVINQAELALCHRIERADRSGEYAVDGATSTTSWVRVQANSSGGLAQRRVRLGRALADRLPHTDEAWAGGVCTVEHADVIAQAVRDLDAEKTEVLDRELSLLAEHVSPIELARAAERFRHEVAPDESAAKARRARRDQKLHHSKTFGGQWVTSGSFDGESGAIIDAAVKAFTPLPTSAGAEGELPESAAYRRAQALTEICRQALEHGQGRGAGGEKPQLVVTVDDEVIREGIGYGTLPDGTPIPASAVRRLACDAKIIPALYGTKSSPLDIGRSSRVIPPAIHRALALRDKGCRFTGCDRPVSWTEGHHIRHWRDGGPTALWNLILLCRAHHHKIHDQGWTIVVLGDGEFRFDPPDPLARTDPSDPSRRRYGRAA